LLAANSKYPVELPERAVRLYRESDPTPVIRRLAEQLNVRPRRCGIGSARRSPTAASAAI